MRASSKPALLGAFCVFSVSCTSAVSEDAGLDVGPSSLALLSVERSGEGNDAPARLTANAKVARFRGMDGEALLKLLGAETRDLESCGTASSIDDSAVSPHAQVELLSVGTIELHWAGAAHNFAPRLFPALATTASGWFYAGSAELSEGPEGGDEFALSAAGEAGLGKFRVRGSTPPEVKNVAVSGLPLENGVALSRERGVELTWQPESFGDRIEIEVFSAGSLLSCAARDDGQFRISRAQLSALEADDNALLVIRRVRILPVDMSGVESAYVRVAATTNAPIHVEP